MVRLRIAFAIFCCLSCILSVPSIIPLLLMCCLSVVLCVFLYSLFCCIESYTSLYVFHSICSVAKHSLKVPALEGEVDSKTPVFEDGGVLFRCLFLLQFVRFRTPSEIFSVGKTLSSPFKRDNFFSLFCETFFKSSCPLRGGGFKNVCF